MTSNVQLKFYPSFQDEDIIMSANIETSLQKVFQVFAKVYGFSSDTQLRFIDASSGDRIYGSDAQCVKHFVKPFNKENKNMFAEFEVYTEVCGGKGGFGSMLRTIGAQIEKTTNREACRDLSGRRMRDVEREKRLRAAAIKKSKDKIGKTANKKEAAKKKLENLINNPGTSKEIIITEEPLIITDISEKIHEDLEYFHAKTSKNCSSQPEQSSHGTIESTADSDKKDKEPSSCPKDSSKSGDTSAKKNESSSDSDSDGDEDLGKNFWAGI